MILGRVTPQAIWIALLGTAALAAPFAWPGTRVGAPWAACLALNSVIASAVTSLLCAHIAREYERGSWMRISWLLLCGSAAASVVRFLAHAVFIAGPPDWRYLLEWRQVPSVLSLVLLVAGLLVMYKSFTSLGLGFAATRWDWVLLLAVVVVTPIMVWFREGLSESRSPYALVRYLQFASPVLVSVLAGISVPLHRIGSQMEGGQIARSLRYFVLFAFVRALLFLRLVPAVAALPFALVAHSVLVQTIPWLFALAVACRWQIAAGAMAGRSAGAPEDEFASR